MNKLFTKVAALSVGLAMAIGAGVALGSKGSAKAVKAATSDEYVETTLAAGKEVVIVGQNTNYYAMGSAGGTTTAPAAISVTVIDGKMTSMTDLADHIWVVSGDSTGWTFTKKGTSTWLYCTNSNNGVRVGTNASKTFTISSEGYLYHSGTSRYVGIYNSADWRCYTSINNNIKDQTFSFWELNASGTKYDVIDRVDNGSLNRTEVAEGATLEVTIVPEDGYTLPETLTYVYMAGSPVDYTYSNGVVTVVNVQGNITIEAVCPKEPALRIQALYSKADGASVSDVYGIYVGKIDDSNIVMMDGEYGIDIYSKNAFATISYTENVTVLKVSGAISIYNGFYEVVPTSISEAETVPEDQVPATPVVYAAKGGETAEYVSRLTTVTGTVTVAEGSQGNYDGDFDPDNKKDITMTFDLGGDKTLPVFYHRNSQTEEVYNAMKAAVTGGTEITVKGFTAWYKNAIQIKMNGYIPAAEGYTAEDFAQELLDLTDAVCTGYVEGDDNHDELVAIWSILAGADKYPSLASEEKTILADAERDEHGSVVEQAMARYDFLTGKYKLNNFINGRTPVQLRPAIEFEAQNNTTMIIIVAIATVSAVSLAALLIIKKRKHN